MRLVRVIKRVEADYLSGAWTPTVRPQPRRRWRSRADERMTEAQRRKLAALGIEATPGMTKRAASAMIGQYYRTRGRM
jgi:hypothetical protein